MVKSVFKEIIIILLLIIALILLLGILFYDFMPTSKIVPTKVEEHALSEETQAEIEKELSNIKSDEIIKTYTIDSADLDVYEKAKQYNKGKVNPFENYQTNTQENNDESPSSNTNKNNSNNSRSTNNSTSNSNNSTNNSANSSNSSETFLNNTGK